MATPVPPTPVPPTLVPPTPTTGPTPPPGLVDKAWFAFESGVQDQPIVGTLRGGGRGRLPRAERPLAAAGGRVASAVFTYGPGPDDGVQTTHLFVRDAMTGALVAETEWSGGVALSLGPDVLFFIDRPALSRPAGGVYALSFADGSVRTLVKPGDRGNGIRRTPVLSSSGKTFATGIQDRAHWTAEILDVASAKTLSIDVQGWPLLVTDSQLFTVDGTHVYAYDISSGSPQWTMGDVVVQRGYATSDGQTLVLQTGFDPFTAPHDDTGLSAKATAPAITRVGTATGQNRVLLTDCGCYLWTDISSDTTAAVIWQGFSPGYALAAGEGRIPLDLVDVETGALRKNAFVIAGG